MTFLSEIPYLHRIVCIQSKLEIVINSKTRFSLFKFRTDRVSDLRSFLSENIWPIIFRCNK